MPIIGTTRDFQPDQDSPPIPEVEEDYVFALVGRKDPKTEPIPEKWQRPNGATERTTVELEFEVDGGDSDGYRVREWWTLSVFKDPKNPKTIANLRRAIEAMLRCDLDDEEATSQALSALLGREVAPDEVFGIEPVLDALIEHRGRFRAQVYHKARQSDGRVFAHIDPGKISRVRTRAQPLRPAKPEPAAVLDPDDPAFWGDTKESA